MPVEYYRICIDDVCLQLRAWSHQTTLIGSTHPSRNLSIYQFYPSLRISSNTRLINLPRILLLLHKLPPSLPPYSCRFHIPIHIHIHKTQNFPKQHPATTSLLLFLSISIEPRIILPPTPSLPSIHKKQMVYCLTLPFVQLPCLLHPPCRRAQARKQRFGRG